MFPFSVIQPHLFFIPIQVVPQILIVCFFVCAYSAINYSYAQSTVPITFQVSQEVKELLSPIVPLLNNAITQHGKTSAVADSMVKLLNAAGYLDAQVSVELSAADSLRTVVLVEEGGRYRIDNILLTGDSLLIQQAKTLLLPRITGSYFISSFLTSEIQLFLNVMDRSGFAFVSATLKNPYKKNIGQEYYCTLQMEVRENISGYIDSIAVTGNVSTEREVIIRESGIKEGEKYSSSKAALVPRKLNRLKIFEPVQKPEFVVTSAGKGIIRLNLTEKNNGNADGVVGYVPGTLPEQSGYFTGLVNLSFINLLGTARKLYFKWQKTERESQDIELRYYEPSIFGLPLSVEGSYLLRKQDSSYLHQKPELKIDYQLDEAFTLSYLIGQEVIVPSLLSVPRFTVYNSTILNTGVAVRYDTRDDILSPTEGLMSSVQFVYRRKKINGPAEYIQEGAALSFLQSSLESSIDYYYSPFRTQTMALSARAIIRDGDGIEVSDLIKVGGFATLRGYTENRYLTKQFYKIQLEYRLRFEGRGYFYPFADFGVIKNTEKNEFIVLPGYGAGVTFGSGIGLMDISFSLGKGDTFSDAKINFGIKSEF